MRIAIIGGSGFVGTKLIDLLKKSAAYQILNIDIRPSELNPEITHLGNVLDKQLLKKQLSNIDLVILLAAEHRDDVTPVSLYYDVNVQGMRNTLEAMDANGVQRMIFTSSVAVYGLNKANPHEEMPTDPFNHYGKSKLEAERVLRSWHQVNPHCNVNIIRPTVIFGEGNRGNVYNLLNQIASGKFMMIGKGENEKSMSYIGNIIGFIEFLIIKVNSGYNVYNYSDTPDFNTNDLVYHTGNILGKKIPTVRIPYWLGLLGGYGFDVLAFLTRRKLNISSIRVKKFCATTKYDSKKAMSLGFIPPYPMEEGLRRMLKAEFKAI